MGGVVEWYGWVKYHAKLTQNVLFADFTVHRVSLKQLWRLRWHKKYDTNAVLPEWPDWMLRCKDPQ